MRNIITVIILFAMREVIVLDLCTLIPLYPGVGLCLPTVLL